jgi:hypothetical protein
MEEHTCEIQVGLQKARPSIKLTNSKITICITLGERNQTSTSINLVPAMKPGGSKSYFAHVFHDLTCIIDLLTALEASLTYNDLPLIGT